MVDIKEVINKYTIDNSATLKPNLGLNELLELKTELEQIDRLTFLKGNRRAFCYLDEVKDRLKNNFTMDFSNIEIEKENEAIAYKETEFRPNETEADINIYQSVDNTEDS